MKFQFVLDFRKIHKFNIIPEYIPKVIHKKQKSYPSILKLALLTKKVYWSQVQHPPKSENKDLEKAQQKQR